MTTPILDIPESADGEVNQYLRLNEGLRILESATNELLVVSLVAGDVTLTALQFKRAWIFAATGNTVSRVLTVPASKRFFSVVNQGSFDLIVRRGTTDLVLAVGSGSVYYADGSANGLVALSSSGGGGLAYWASSKNTASPNATKPVIGLAANDAATNLDVALLPKGNGAFMLAIPNGNSAGGDKRGIHAVDLQLSRAFTDQVSSGNYSFSAGASCTVSGTNAVGIGVSVISSASNAVGIGKSVTASAAGAVSVGSDCVADAAASFSCGTYAASRSVVGKESYASGRFSAAGDAQRGGLVLRLQTADATPGRLTSNATAAAATNQLALPNSLAFVVRGRVSARQNTTGDAKAWSFECAIKRGANAAATAMMAACVPVVVAEDAGAAAWALSVAADTTNGTLSVTGTGEASKSIKWVCVLDSCEAVG